LDIAGVGSGLGAFGDFGVAVATVVLELGDGGGADLGGVAVGMIIGISRCEFYGSFLTITLLGC
jgi:hypothetical protein